MAKTPTSSVPRIPTFLGPAAEVRVQQNLGLPTTEPLTGSVTAGAGRARLTTPYHPVSYRGTVMWAETHAALVSNLQPFGWIPHRLNGAELIRHEQRGRVIIVTAGDSASGVAKFVPQVRYERQAVISGLVNGFFDTLFDAYRPAKWTVSFLLHHLGPTTVGAELSEPRGVTSRGHVADWNERIILPAFDFGGGDGGGRSQPVEPAEPGPVEVTVSRRAG